MSKEEERMRVHWMTGFDAHKAPSVRTRPAEADDVHASRRRRREPFVDLITQGLLFNGFHLKPRYCWPRAARYALPNVLRFQLRRRCVSLVRIESKQIQDDQNDGPVLGDDLNA